MSKSTPSNIPGVAMMSDTLDFFKNMWSSVPGMNLPGMNIPGMVMPTLSVDEIDKQIKDLKAVESWLSLNMNMLQGTIQALEVQKATISTLQTMSDSFSAAMQPPTMSTTPEKAAFQSPFSAPNNTADRKPENKPEPAAKPAEVKEAAVASEPNADAAAQPAMGMPDMAGMAGVPPLANPAAWWNMLQDQFKQAVDTAAAMTPEAPTATASMDTKTKTEPAAASSPRKRKPASKAKK